jgi:hypothetical protein
MEIAADRTGSMAFAFQAALRLSNVAFAAQLEISADGSLLSIRSRRLRLRLEIQQLPRDALGQEPAFAQV